MTTTTGIERINERVTVKLSRNFRYGVFVDGRIYLALVSEEWLTRNLPTIIRLVFTHHDETHVGNGKWVKK